MGIPVKSQGNWIVGVSSGLLAVSLLLACSGCLYLGPGVPVHVPKQTTDISGEKRDLDLTFLKTGSTTREEVTKNLAPIDAGVNEPRFFWGRWETSSWVSAPLLAPYPPFTGRVWVTQNILIAFDSQNLVQGWKVLKDKELFPELDRLEPTPAAALDLTSPVQLNVELPFEYGSARPLATLVLSSASFQYETESRKVETPRGNLQKISSAPEDTPSDPSVKLGPDAAHIWIRLHFAKRTKAGKSLLFGVEPPGLLLLRRYMREAKNPAASRDHAPHPGSLTPAPRLLARVVLRGDPASVLEGRRF